MQSFENQKKTAIKSKTINLAGYGLVNNDPALPIFSELAVGLRVPAEC
jgi:hypothetical protein